MTSASSHSRRSAIRPSVALGIGAVVAYSLVTNWIQWNSGIAYADWFRTADNAWRVAVASLAAGGGLLLAFALAVRWRHLWSDPLRLETTLIMKVAMVLWWVAIAVRLAGVQWREVPPDLLLAILMSGILVGIAEETLFRGVFLRCMREGGRNEAAAATWTAVAFGLFHVPNMFMGTGWAGSLQIVLAATSGALLYAFRRQYGVIWPAMIAHGTWDISTFLAGGFASPWLTSTVLPMLALQLVLGVGVLISILRHDRRTVAIPVPGN